MRSAVRFVLGVAAALGMGVNAQDHGHINAGAESQQPGSKLIIANAADFATNTLYVKTLTFTNAARFAGFFQGNTTITVLAATAELGGPEPFAPALGSYIFAQLVSLEGPAGGEFGFWEAGATEPTISIASGANGTGTWRITEADGSAGTDPYGHIHGRRWTLNKPGIYKVGFRMLDKSVNGPTGGPIHQQSDVLYTFVQAGVNIVDVRADMGHFMVRTTAPLGSNWQVESADSLAEPIVWTSVGDAIVGNDIIREVMDERPAAGAGRFYRVRQVAP